MFGLGDLKALVIALAVTFGTGAGIGEPTSIGDGDAALASPATADGTVGTSSQTTAPGGNSNGGGPSPNPADRTAAVASTVEYMDADDVVELFSTSIKTSTPTSLLITLTAECAVWTQVIVSDNPDPANMIFGHSKAEARVTVWVEVNGAPVPVGSGDVASEDPPNSPGEVVFCNQVHEFEVLEEETADEDHDNATFRHYLEARNANAFQWLALEPGQGPHEVVVKARLEGINHMGDATAEGGVGKRMLVIDPIKMPPGTTF